ncbi:MAG: hypothetical protein HOO67_03340 [Candidatus Peribacteraceae bacterium]|nr:hypothetical protein [Candidatus Peribacteraceae bacterium]
MLSPSSPQKKLAETVSDLLEKEQPFEAANAIRKFSGLPTDIVEKSEAFLTLNQFLHWLLNNNAQEEAALMLWGPTQFDPRPESTRRVWKAFETHNNILLMGAGSMSKSFSMAIKLFLEWIRDPEYTTIKVLGPSEQHLEDNLFTHLVQLHKSSRIPLPGQVGKLFIGLDSRSRKSSITGVVIPLGKKAAGRLQGVKRMPRKKAHPTFGKLSRLFIFLDEIANIPVGIWRDIDNILSNTNGDGLKIIGAFNPTDQNDPVGLRCEPPFGWPSFDADEHYEWLSTRGWFVVRLDAARCENVVQKKVIYPGLQTIEGFEIIISNSGGMDTPGYWAMARGCFPPTGTVMSVITPGMIEKWKAEVIWYETPTPCAGVDLALEGGDACKMARGLFGKAVGVKFPPTLQNPEGLTVFFLDKRGRKLPREVLQVTKIFKLPKAETVAMQEEIVRLCKSMKIPGEFLAVDRTGNGQGVADLIRYNWSAAITAVNFSEGASETRIMAEDKDTAHDAYDRVHTELWMALRKFIEFGYCYAAPDLEMVDLTPQLTGRLYRVTGRKSKVESKQDYKSRNQGKSPDDADSVCVLLHGVRKASGFVPGMASENSSVSTDDDYDEDYGNRVDVTNRFDDL